MQEQYLNPLKALNYANLTEDQEERLREFEKQFNTDFGKQTYFMVMER
ncbi:polynucleotide phosphorylase [Geosporobacter ferrireducens]|uniref:Polynucleotide phosphorylase n=1 Tax=Geosporobacter ferrireducens TaxID=1424294 RepID=A0A1D8GD89_9FIRM|nr:polynucleotide phosphorylase [Geosporobacter ferrireducens]AOT68871.1 polynucleotide phosphorylase [Geosporobacter ferrireducens]MTI54897.1 DEAD/DEAH box helicase [Geosporobacter ferrireducens]